MSDDCLSPTRSSGTTDDGVYLCMDGAQEINCSFFIVVVWSMCRPSP
jgi:hypothetical protein